MITGLRRTRRILAACFAAWARTPRATTALLAFTGMLAFSASHAGPQEHNWSDEGKTLTLIQIGDLHGHLAPRPNLRSDGTDPKEEGGLAWMYAKIKAIRKQEPNALLFNVGDTIQGGAEVLYTRGQAMVDILDDWGIQGYAPGNWDFVYGAQRFLELFGNGRWGAVAANVYYDVAVYPDKAGQRVLPPYRVLQIDGVKVGVLGLTSERGLPAVPGATTGFVFTGDGRELPELIDRLRNQEKVDVLILLSEFGLAKNVALAERYPGLDAVLSADMHEETPRVVQAATGTLVSEVGQDGTQMARLAFRVAGGRVSGWQYEFITVDTTDLPDPLTALKVYAARKEFVNGPWFRPHANPFNGMVLKTPIDTVVGRTEVSLYRANFSDEGMPGVVEGSSHDFLTDAFRIQADVDLAVIRGFRYGTHVRPGPIRLEDLYHYIPIGPQIATGTVTGQAIKNAIENSTDGALNTDVFAWTGGWLFGYSGVKFDLDPYAARGSRAANIQVWRRATGSWEPLDPVATYSVASYWYEADPNNVGGLRAANVIPLRGAAGETLDATEVVVGYLATHSANPEPNRIRLLAPLPAAVYGNREIQPLHGAPSLH